MTEKCICKICDCGKHKCPHKMKPVEQWGREVTSEYGGQYHPHDTCRPQSCKPPINAIQNDSPLSSQTTNRADYVAHDVKPPQKFESPGYEPPTEPMDATSSYRHAYTEMPACASKPIKPVAERVNNGKFESETTNRSTYVPHDVKPPTRAVQEKYKPVKEPFQNMTSNRADYVKHDINKPHSCKPPHTSLQSDKPFANTTENRERYVEHNVQPPQPFLHEKYVKPDTPFESETTNRSNYVNHNVAPSKSCKPPMHKVDCNEPFNSSTTNRSDYVSHNVSPPEKFLPEKYVKPEGDMDLLSTYNQQYKPQPDCKAQSIKPPQNAICNEPFDGRTSYNQNYVNHNQPANIVHHKDKYLPPTAPFDDTTTSRSAYVQHDICKPNSFKPPNTALDSQPFDSQTLYRSHYVDKQIPICPAACLPPSDGKTVASGGYIFTGEDEDGHKYFSNSLSDKRERFTDCHQIPIQINANNSESLGNEIVVPESIQ